ncbi:MAG TPA: serine hydrolase domain-containing protein [Chryseolinea sp.]
MKTLLFFLFYPSILFAQVDSTDIIVKRLMDEQKIIGLSLAVVKNGQAVINRAYGLADVELNVTLTSETVIKLGSVSKQFVSTAIMELAEDGLLSIEDPVHKFFPDAPESWRSIRVKNLLSHSSGLQREGSAFDLSKKQPDLDIIRSAYIQPLDFKTGEKYQYSNLAYYILAEIITQVSGMPWQNFIHQTLFVPAGMQNSYITDFYAIIPNRASGYTYRNDTLVNAQTMYAIRPSGGFQSTTSDMIKWEKILLEKKIILKKDNWERLWQPYTKMSAESESKAYYGFGWAIDEYKGHKIIVHGGSTPGFKSVYMRFLEDKLSIIVLCNTYEANPHSIGFALAEHYFRNR